MQQVDHFNTEIIYNFFEKIDCFFLMPFFLKHFRYIAKMPFKRTEKMYLPLMMSFRTSESTKSIINIRFLQENLS